MASQISHIVIADKLFDKYFAKLDRRAFYVGTVFPDIRYLGEVERTVTHGGKVLFTDALTETNAFEAGMILHRSFDLARERFLISQGIYNYYPKDWITMSALKMYEDELFYGEVKRWEEIRSFFNSVLDDEKKWGVSEQSLLKWHTGLSDYFTHQPTDESRKHFSNLLGIEDGISQEISERLVQIKNDASIQEIEQKVLDGLEKILISQSN